MANGLTPDIVGSFLRGRQANQQNQLFEQQFAQNEQKLEQGRQQQAQQQQTQDLTRGILSGDQQDAKLQELFAINPKAAEQVVGGLGLLDQRKRDQAASFADDLINTAPNQREAKIRARAQNLVDPSDTLSLLDQTTEQQDQALRVTRQAVLSLKDREKARLRAGSAAPQKDVAGVSEFKFLSQAANLTADDLEKAARIELRLDAPAAGSAIQTITDKGIATAIADTEETIAKGKETGKLTAKLALAPRLAADIEKAKAEAKAKGETFTDLKRMNAGMPGLLEAVAQLKDLSLLSTSTLGGRVFDTLVKEAGFGSTEGASARIKMISIVDNQIIPLLRETFGAAFTFLEGESLKKSFVDPDASP